MTETHHIPIRAGAFQRALSKALHGMSFVAYMLPLTLFLAPQAARSAPDAAAANALATDSDVQVDSGINMDSLVRVIQQRPVLKTNRFGLFLGGGLGVNDVMTHHYLATVAGRFHITESLSVAASYSHYFSSSTSLQKDIGTSFEVYPELSKIRWFAGAEVSYVLFEGKFSFFDAAISYWDLYASIGGGVTVTHRSDDVKPTGSIGAGWRFYFNPWLTLSFELRDYIFQEKYNAGDAIINNVVGQAGLTFLIPFTYDYKYEE